MVESPQNQSYERITTFEIAVKVEIFPVILIFFEVHFPPFWHNTPPLWYQRRGLRTGVKRNILLFFATVHYIAIMDKWDKNGGGPYGLPARPSDADGIRAWYRDNAVNLVRRRRFVAEKKASRERAKQKIWTIYCAEKAKPHDSEVEVRDRVFKMSGLDSRKWFEMIIDGQVEKYGTNVLNLEAKDLHVALRRLADASYDAVMEIEGQIATLEVQVHADPESSVEVESYEGGKGGNSKKMIPCTVALRQLHQERIKLLKELPAAVAGLMPKQQFTVVQAQVEEKPQITEDQAKAVWGLVRNVVQAEYEVVSDKPETT